ncbi:MAG: sodium:solute symporter [Planctomycetaceae bacterium]
MLGIDALLFLALSASLLGGSLRAARREETFLVADRRVGFFPLTATLVMTEFNTATLLAFAAMGYTVGPRAIGLAAVFLVGLGWYTLTVARQWKRYNGLSVAGWFSLRYGPALGRTASLMLIAAMVGFSATYVKSLTLLFLPNVESLSPWTLSGALCLVIAGVTMSGGLASVVRMDVLSFLVTIVLLPLLLVRGWWLSDGASSGEPAVLDYWLAWNHPQLPWWFVISLFSLTCLTYISSPWYGQKIFAAVDEQTAVRAVAMASVLVFCLYASVQVAAGFLAASEPPLSDPQLAVPTMVQVWLPVGLRGAGFAVLFAAATTTLAGVWSAMVAMVASDFDFQWSRNVASQRLLTAVFALASWLGGNLLVEDILNRLILANIPIAALSFALLGGFHWNGASRVGAWASIVVGIVWGVFCFIYWGDAGGYTWPWAIYGVGLIFGTGFTMSRLFPDRGSRPVSSMTDTVEDRLESSAMGDMESGSAGNLRLKTALNATFLQRGLSGR